MECKINYADFHRRETPKHNDDELRRRLRDVLIDRPRTIPDYNNPEWKLYRSLICREAHRRGITL